MIYGDVCEMLGLSVRCWGGGVEARVGFWCEMRRPNPHAMMEVRIFKGVRHEVC